MIINKINKNILFAIECISIILGGISTFVITILTIRLAKEKQQKKLAKMISFIPVIALFLSVLINSILGKTGVITVIIFYIVFALATVILIFIQKYLLKINDETSVVVHPTTKKVKSKVFVVLAIYSILLSIIIVVMLFIAESKVIDDTNGIENFALQTISDDMLRKAENTFTASKVEHGNYGEKTYVSRNAVADFDRVAYCAETSSGVQVLQATKSLSDTLKLTIKNSIVSGNCKIVVVVENEIYKEIELNSETTLTIENVLNKEIFVVIGCESAKVDIEILREFLEEKTGQSGDGSVIDNSTTKT